MAGPQAKEHWEAAYAEKPPERVSWFEKTPADSLALIERAAPDRDAAIIDVGGGASRLASALVARGHTDVTVADISAAALERGRAQIPAGSSRVTFVEADVREHDFGRRFGLWHDRAVLHFMVGEADRAAYLGTMLRSLLPGAHAILATFGPDGPTSCSGLPVARYDERGLGALLGERFEPLASHLHLHRTPSGNEQQFQYALFRRT